jgi:acyl-CoA thioester hydrolase
MKPRFPVKTEEHVRFADVDSMGHVNNAVYLSYFEQARVAFFKKLSALDLRFMNSKSAFGFIVAEIAVQFLSPAYLDETMVVRIRIAEMRNKAFRFEYEIADKKTKRPVARGHSVQVMYNYKKHLSFPIPAALRKKMESL